MCVCVCVCVNLESSKGVCLLLSTVDLLSQDGPLSLLIQLCNTEIIHLGTETEREDEEEKSGERGEKEHKKERGRELLALIILLV